MKPSQDPIYTATQCFQPGKFLGNRSFAYGGGLQFELKQAGATLSTNCPQVKLSSGGVSLFFSTTNAPGADWTSYTIPLLENRGWRRADGLPAWPEEIAQVLSSLDDIQIYGQFKAAGESSSLDEVLFLAPCSEEAPVLAIRYLAAPPVVVLEWPLNALCCQLETALSLSPSDWTTNVPVVNATVSNNLNVLTVTPARSGTYLSPNPPQTPSLSSLHARQPMLSIQVAWLG